LTWTVRDGLDRIDFATRREIVRCLAQVTRIEIERVRIRYHAYNVSHPPGCIRRLVVIRKLAIPSLDRFRFSAPAGAAECRHGWSVAATESPDAKPVDSFPSASTYPGRGNGSSAAVLPDDVAELPPALRDGRRKTSRDP
jgi:hypothetical protein